MWTWRGGEPVNWENLLGEVVEITSVFLVRASTLSACYSTLQCRDILGSKILVETAGTAKVVLSSIANEKCTKMFRGSTVICAFDAFRVIRQLHGS